MLNYSNDSSFSPIEERFGYQTTGSFLCATELDTATMIVLHTAAVIIAVVLDIVILGPHANINEFLFYGIMTAMFEAAWFFIIASVIKMAMRGVRYTYTADAKRFITKYKDEVLVFEYTQVKSVTYTPLYYFKYQRGYKVRIETAGFTKTFVYLFEKMRLSYPTEKTPFNIIEERAGLKKYEAYTRLSDEETEKEHIEGVGDISIEKGKSGVPLKGIFNSPLKKYFPLTAVFSAVLLILFGGMVYCVVTLAMNNGLRRFATDTALAGLTVVFLVWLWLTLRVIHKLYNGEPNKYEFDGKEFSAYDRFGVRQSIYKCDVTMVNYYPLTLYFMKFGYNVEVVTRYRTFEFTYLFPNRNEPVPTAETPFVLLVEHEE